MKNVHELLFEETGREIFHESPTVQASASWEVHDLTETVDAAEYIAASGVATMDAVALGVTGTVGPSTANAKRLAMPSTTAIVVGRTYLLGDTTGSEPVVVVGLTTDTYADLEHPIVGTYTAPTLSGLRMTASLPDSIAATEAYVDYDEPLRIVWTYSNGSHHQEGIRVVRHDHGDSNLVQILDAVRGLFPDVGTRIEHQGGNTLPKFVQLYIEQYRATLLADGDVPERVLHGEQGQWIVIWGVLEHLAAMGNAPGQEDVTAWSEHCTKNREKWEGNIRRGLAGARTAKIVPQTENAEGSVDATPRSRIHFG